MAEETEIQTRPRISGIKADPAMVKGLLSTDLEIRDQWLVNAMGHIKLETLASVEEAIAQKCKRADICFYQTGGMVRTETSIRKQYAEQIFSFARTSQMLDDVVKTQYCMARVGQEQHSRLMQELKSISADAVHNYQLLGTQMQLAILLERSTTSG